MQDEGRGYRELRTPAVEVETLEAGGSSYRKMRPLAVEKTPLHNYSKVRIASVAMEPPHASVGGERSTQMLTTEEKLLFRWH